MKTKEAILTPPQPEVPKPSKFTNTSIEVTPLKVDAPPVDATRPVGIDLPDPSEPPQKMTYTQMYDAVAKRPETPEEQARREKRERSHAILSGVGDAITALSNLYFTTQYAPNAYDPSQGMSVKARTRYDRLRAEREANRRAYQDGYLRAAAMDKAEEKDDRNWRHTLYRERISDERYEVKAAQDRALADLNERLKSHQITAAEYKAEQERIAAMFAPEYEASRINRNNEAARASRASSTASYSRADYYRNGGSSGGKHGPTLQLEEDEPMRFGDDKDYDRTVMRLAQDYGVPTTVEVVTEWGTQYNAGTKTRERVPKKTRKENRPVKDIAADIEREAAKRRGEPNKGTGYDKEKKNKGY